MGCTPAQLLVVLVQAGDALAQLGLALAHDAPQLRFSLLRGALRRRHLAAARRPRPLLRLDL